MRNSIRGRQLSSSASAPIQLTETYPLLRSRNRLGQSRLELEPNFVLSGGFLTRPLLGRSSGRIGLAATLITPGRSWRPLAAGSCECGMHDSPDGGGSEHARIFRTCNQHNTITLLMQVEYQKALSDPRGTAQSCIARSNCSSALYF